MAKSNKQRKQEIKQKRSQKVTTPTSPYRNEESHLNYTPDYLTNFNTTSTLATDHSSLSRNMRQIIQEGYALFSHYSAPKRFNVCTYCCMTLPEEEALRTLPLPLLPRELIWSYNDSAKDKLESKDEVAYLLPRILELIALNEEIHHSPELYLSWVAQTPIEQWTEEEKGFLAGFAIQYTKDVIQHAAQEHCIASIDSILIMFSYANIHIEPILTYMAQSTDYYVITSLASLIGQSKGETNFITNSFIDHCPILNNTFDIWLKKNKTQLCQNAQQAILHPEDISAVSDFVKYEVELGLCYLSNGT